ncbi:MAG TPA: hypothetical protein VN257_02730 [Actinotalea sp.]|nr:hypothetical protein [Actinotalea sp.]
MTAPARIQGPGPDGADHRPEGPVAVPDPTPAQLVALASQEWRAALAARAGESALTDVDRLGEAQLDLSAAHPSGTAQLFAGRPTRLSNLVREGAALSTAKRRARAVGALADDHAQRFGLATAFLAIGVATWTEDQPEPSRPGAHRRAPVLLRPVTVTPRGRGEADYDLVLEPSLEVNPVLASALRRRGALLDPNALARGAFTESGFDPRAALDRLRALGIAVLDGFELDERILVGTFVHPEQSLVDDLDAQAGTLAAHEVVAALAGDERAVAALGHPLPPVLRGDRPLDQERGVGDLDATQAHVLDALAAGHHLLVDAPAGSDVAGTLAAVVADAAASGRTVLYVAGHRRAATALVERLDALGLAELVLDVAPDSGWRVEAGRRLLGAMTAEPLAVDTAKIDIVDRELADRRRRLHGYIDALHAPRAPWGASAYDSLQALARLTSVRPAPRTAVRLTPPVAESLTAERRAQAGADLVTVAGLGAFAASTPTTAWYGAEILTADRARAALAAVDRLHDDALPRLREQVVAVAEATGLTPAATPAEWDEQLAMLAGVRGALDVFQPIAFERSAADLVAATASREWRAEHGVEMSRGVRRRLRRQAKDLLRPGRPVDDLHAALLDVQARRQVWQAHCPAGGWPRIPEGLASIEADHREVRDVLDALSRVLTPTAGGGDLDRLTWQALAERLRRLQLDRTALDTLPERTALLRSLQARGLDDLLADLTARRVPAGLVGAELELAWWSTVFEEILRMDPAMAGYDGAALARLVAEFRTLDRRHLADRAVLHTAAARESLRTRLRGADEQTQALFGEIVEDRFTSLRHAVERYPDIARHLRPCLVAAPMLVPHVLPPTRTEDLVILDAVAHLPIETVVGVLARGRQVLVVGDTRCTSGTAVERLAAVLPAVALHADASRRDPRLTTFLSDHGYAGRLTATPLPSTAGLLRLDVVDGTGMPAANGAVESTRAEVERVVDLVVEHALTRPEESLAVVCASVVHADRVREAVLAQVRDNPALGPFFGPGRAEPFVVTDVAATQGLSRQAVILSVGFGKTPHGRVLHRFGALSEPGGQGRLLEALGATRQRLVVVSCFTAADLDPERLAAPGARLLADLLELAVADPGPQRPERAAPVGRGEVDRLVLDLAERLWRMGLTVALDHGTPGGPRIPMVVGHPDLPGEMLVAVLTDDDGYLAEASVRVRDRQVAERLEALGWTVVQLWSAAAFLDPQAEAEAVAEAAIEACRARLAARPPVAQVLPAGLDEDGGDGPAGAADDGDPAEGSDATTGEGDISTAGGDATTGGGDATTGGTGDVRPTPSVRTAQGSPDLDEDDVAWPAPGPIPGGRPPIDRGLPIGAYSDDQLDDLHAWIRADGAERDEAELASALRAELGIVRRGSRIDAAVNGAVRRAR